MYIMCSGRRIIFNHTKHEGVVIGFRCNSNRIFPRKIADVTFFLNVDNLYQNFIFRVMTRQFGKIPVSFTLQDIFHILRAQQKFGMLIFFTTKHKLCVSFRRFQARLYDIYKAGLMILLCRRCPEIRTCKIKTCFKRRPR